MTKSPYFELLTTCQIPRVLKVFTVHREFVQYPGWAWGFQNNTLLVSLDFVVAEYKERKDCELSKRLKCLVLSKFFLSMAGWFVCSPGPIAENTRYFPLLRNGFQILARSLFFSITKSTASQLAWYLSSSLPIQLFFPPSIPKKYYTSPQKFTIVITANIGL